MMDAALCRIATAVLVFLAALPCFARDAQTPAESIAVQMYTLRDVASLDEQLKIVQDAGVHAVETGFTHDVAASEFKQLADKHSIKVTSIHVQLADLRNDFDGVVAFNKAIGSTTLVIPYLPKEAQPSDAAGWIALGKELGKLSKKVRAKGMTLAYHNHMFEIVDFNGKTGLELLFEGAGSKLKAELDVGWVSRAGYDPVVMLGKLSGCVFAIHAKDHAPAGEAKEEGGFTAVGKGVVDWNTVLPAAAKAGVQWYIIEHDHPLDPAAVVKTSADYLREHLPANANR